MIVVGVLRPSESSSEAVSSVASRAAGAAPQPRVEVVGVLPPGAEADARLLELSTAGVGHATVIRSGADDLEPADLDLALRYLPDLRVIVLVKPDSALIPTAAAASEWSGATLVLLTAAEPDDASVSLPDRSIVLAPPASDPDGTFAGFVAALAVRLDGGASVERAWRATVGALAVDEVTSTT